jgi:vacuolar-type H+-ATPase subunit H
MSPHREKIVSSIVELQNIHKLALRLGILGTFIGLLLAISQLGGFLQAPTALADSASIDIVQRLESDQQNFALIIPHLFDALKVSFGTSVAGLEVSVLLGIVVMLLSKQMEHYFRDMEDAAGTMLSLARNAENPDAYFTEFRQIRNSLQQLEGKIYNQTKSITEELSQIGESLKDQTVDFETRLDRFQTIRKEWNSFFEDIQSTQKSLLSSSEKSNKELISHIEKSQSGVTESFEELLKQFETSQTKLVENVQTSQEKMLSDINTSQLTMIENSEGFIKKLETSQQQFLDDTQKVLDLLSVNNLGEQLSKSIKNAGSTISSDVKPQIEMFSKEISKLRIYNTILWVVIVVIVIDQGWDIQAQFNELKNFIFSKISR